MRKKIYTIIHSMYLQFQGTRIIEDYGDGRQRVTVNGEEEIQPVQQQQTLNYRREQDRIPKQQNPYQMPETNGPYTSSKYNNNE